MLQDGSQAPLGSSLDDPKVQAGLITAALISGFSKGGPGPAASTLPGNLLEMHMLGPNCRSTESETLGLGSAICALTSPPTGHFDAHSSFRGLPCSDGKESTCNVGDLGSIPELGRSPGEGKSYLIQYSGLKNSGRTESDLIERFSLSWLFSLGNELTK